MCLSTFPKMLSNEPHLLVYANFFIKSELALSIFLTNRSSTLMSKEGLVFSAFLLVGVHSLHGSSTGEVMWRVEETMKLSRERDREREMLSLLSVSAQIEGISS